MILQALKEYYDRKADDLPRAGWVNKGIDYAITLTKDGCFQQLECCQSIENGKLTPFPSVAPSIGKQGSKHTNSGADANLLWDNSAFVLGIGSKGQKKRNSFVEAITRWLGDVRDDGVSAVLSFLSAVNRNPATLSPILNHEDYGEDIRTGNPIVTFRLVGDEFGFIYERPIVKSAISDKWQTLTDHCGEEVCLVTGQREHIEPCHTVIKGVNGAQTSGATIVGFNKAAFRSFNKEQGKNASVGKTASFAYTTALNHLLNRYSRQRMLIGDCTTVFWAEKANDFETGIVDIFNEPTKDYPDRGINAVRSLYKSVENGAFIPVNDKTKFYVLGLSAPSKARLTVRYWIRDTVATMGCKILQHFEDLRIVEYGCYEEKYGGWLPLAALLASSGRQIKRPQNPNPGQIQYMGKWYEISTNGEHEIMRAILGGMPYPQTLLQAAVRRAKAEQSAKDKKTGKPILNITYARASLIKACINRETRFRNPEIKEELRMSLDKTNKNIGYRLGRLFATFEALQYRANPGINTTIRDRYYGAFSSTPVVAFGTLNRLHNHHLAKLDSKAERAFFKRLLQEIMDDVCDFPLHLNLADQGRFAIGYYHQTQQLYGKKIQREDKPQPISEGEQQND